MELLSKNASFLSRLPGRFLISECKSTHFFNNCQNFLEENLKVKYSRTGVFGVKSATTQSIMCNKKNCIWFLFARRLAGADCKMQVFITLAK